nr:synaptobrevin, longin-like domain protein [Tanacetum cinerariifolium]
VEHAMRGFVKGNIIIYTSFVSHIDLGWVIGTFKYPGVLRILMISLRLIPLGERNVDFHHMVDFIEAYPLRIETTEEGTKILATVDGIVRTVFESSLRQNLKLRDEEGISSLPDAELFKNLTVMGYNISSNQKFSFQKGKFSHQWKYLIHTIMQCLSPKSTGFNEFSSNIATALIYLATNMTYNFSKMIFNGLVKNVNNKVLKFLMYPRQYTRRTRIAQSSVPLTIADEPASPQRDVSQEEACPTDYGFIADQDMATIDKSSTLPYDSAPRVTSPAAVEGSMQQTIPELMALCTSLQRQLTELTDKFQAQEMEINQLKEIVKLLKEREGVAATKSRDDALIKRRSMDEREAATERVSDDTEEMAIVLTLMDAATVLASGVVNVSTGSGSIPTASIIDEDSVPTGSEEVPTASSVSAIITVVTPVIRRNGKEVMVESKTPKKQKVQEQIDAQVARELEEQIEREDQRRADQIARDDEIARIHAEEELQSMIDGLDKNNETVANYLEEYHQFYSELPMERRIELISDLVKYQDNYAKIYKFQSQQRKPWTKKQKRDYYMAVIRSNLGWKVKDFRGMTFEEVEAKFNSVWKQIEDFIPIEERKGITLEQKSAKKQKTSEEVTKEAKPPEEVTKENVKEMMQLVPIEEVYVEALQAKHPIINWKVYHEGQRSYWKITRVHCVAAKDKEIFMLVEKDYPLKKGLALVMICYKLQVENYSQMGSDLVLKIHKIASSQSQRVKKDATARRKVKPLPGSLHCCAKSRKNCQSKSNDSFT